MGSVAQWFFFAVRLCIVVVLTPVLMIGISVGSSLAGWELLGLVWPALGVLFLPTVIASLLSLIEFRNVKQAFIRGVLLGLVASLVLVVIGFVLLFIVAGSMDGGI